jgi:putative transcriptional regulator
MENPPYSHLDKGTLLIATPEIEEGLFFRSVILLCEHASTGSFGIIINKPLELEVPEEIISLQNQQNPHLEMRAGGPVQTSQMMLIHSCESVKSQTIEICQEVYLGGDMAFLQEAISNPSGPAIRLCFGYTGWAAGALEREFLNGDWFLHPCRKEHVFSIPPEKLWQTVLKEMGGRYATLAMMPSDLMLN